MRLAMENKRMPGGSYGKFAITLAISFAVMYAVMFLNVYDTGHIYISLNRFYMAMLMVSPMAVVMMAMMSSMYANKKWNRAIMAGGTLVFLLSFAALRNQAAVGDVQYMRGMIPHHSSAILTSTQANIKDPEVRKLADGIIATQEREIAEMKEILKRMEK